MQVCFIVLLLGTSSAMFNHDAETLVIRPLAKMAALVQKMSANPLAEITDRSVKALFWASGSGTDSWGCSGGGGEFETDFVESALKKFGKLLQVAAVWVMWVTCDIRSPLGKRVRRSLGLT